VRDLNAQALANHAKCRWETVSTVLAMFGAALTAWAGFDPDSLGPLTHIGPEAARYAALAGRANTAGLVIWGRKLSRKEIDAPHRIAAPGAMFHQIDAETGFQYRTGRSHNEGLRDPIRF
jgi:hypothetical protein